MFEVQEGHHPASLQEMVDAGLLAKKYTQDEWGRDLICSNRNGKLVVRSIRRGQNTQHRRRLG